jgi:hypothetical protein
VEDQAAEVDRAVEDQAAEVDRAVEEIVRAVADAAAPEAGQARVAVEAEAADRTVLKVSANRGALRHRRVRASNRGTLHLREASDALPQARQAS